MAERKATLILELKDLTSKGLSSIGTGLSSLRGHFLALSAAVAGLTAFLVSSVKAYLEQENANEKLNQALKNQGVFTEQTARELQNYAAELQKTTTFQDEVIVETEALLTTFGLAGKTLKDATKLSLDLSVALGIDLKSAAMLLGKSISGESVSFGKFKLAISETTPRAERLALVMEQLNQKVGGQAEARLSTTSGQIENFSNRVGDLKERIGALLIPALTSLLDILSKVVSVFESLLNSTAPAERFASLVGKIFLDLGKLIVDALISPFKFIDPILGKFGVSFSALGAVAKNEIDSIKEKLDEWALAAETNAQKIIETEGFKNETLNQMTQSRRDQLALWDEEDRIKEEEKRAEELAKLDQQTQEILMSLQTRQQQQESLSQHFVGKQLLLLDKYLSDSEKRNLASHLKALKEQGKYEDAALIQRQAFLKVQEKAEEETEERRKLRLQNGVSVFQTALGQMRDIFGSHSKAVFLIDKASAISQAIINTALGAARALALGPFVGPVMAGVIKALGAAQIAVISSQTIAGLADGGVVLPRPGGTLATIGEGGNAEAVIPLGDRRAQEALEGSGFGGGVTIQVGTLIADERGIKELARRIDEALFELGRNQERIS